MVKGSQAFPLGRTNDSFVEIYMQTTRSWRQRIQQANEYK